MRVFVSSLLLAGATVVAAPAPVQRADRRSDLERLQGRWEWTSEEGVKTAVISDNRIRWCVGETDECEQAFGLDPAKNPKAIDLIVNLGSDSYTAIGVYSLEGDTLTIHQSGVDRPPSFTARGGDSLTVFRRKSP